MDATMTAPAPDFAERDKLQNDLAAACQRRDAQDGVVARLSLAARNAKAAVDRALRDVAAGGAQQSLAEVRLEQRGADDALLQGQELRDAIQLHIEETQAAIRTAAAAAFQPAMQHAARESIAACQDFCDAKAALHAAVMRKRAANAVANQAIARGAHRPFDGADLEPIPNHSSRPQPPEFGHLLRTPEEEADLWSGVL